VKKHHIAEYQEKRSAELREKVRSFCTENPFANAKQTAEALGMTYQTVARYIRDFKRAEAGK